MIVEIYWGYYTFNTKTKVVKRNKPGMGTRVGKPLKPFRPGGHHNYITPFIKGKKYVTSIEKLSSKYG